jgi:hypothetical protein
MAIASLPSTSMKFYGRVWKGVTGLALARFERFDASRAKNQNCKPDGRVLIQVGCRGELLQTYLLIHFSGLF